MKIFTTGETVFYDNVKCLVTLGISPKATKEKIPEEYQIRIQPCNGDDSIKGLTAGYPAYVSSKDELLSASAPQRDNPDYLEGLIDGYGGEEPIDELPHGFRDINEVYDHLASLKKHQQ